MIFYVNAKAKRNGNGSKASPFKTINQAAAIARAGDEVLVAPGIYREQVVPKAGGSGDEPDQRSDPRDEEAGGLLQGQHRLFAPADGQAGKERIAARMWRAADAFWTGLLQGGRLWRKTS